MTFHLKHKKTEQAIYQNLFVVKLPKANNSAKEKLKTLQTKIHQSLKIYLKFIARQSILTTEKRKKFSKRFVCTNFQMKKFQVISFSYSNYLKHHKFCKTPLLSAQQNQQIHISDLIFFLR